jgi:hypothetical protein
MTGSSAHKALADTAKLRLRITIARIGAECRTKRMPLPIPDNSVSGTPGSACSWRFHPRTTKIMPTNRTALARNALPEPTQAAMAPAIAGPTARETFIATAPSATACGTSERPTSSLMLADCAGM